MSPIDALKLVDGVLQNVPGTRLDHDKLRSAVAVLEQAITPPAPPASTEEPKPQRKVK